MRAKLLKFAIKDVFFAKHLPLRNQHQLKVARYLPLLILVRYSAIILLGLSLGHQVPKRRIDNTNIVFVHRIGFHKLSHLLLRGVWAEQPLHFYLLRNFLLLEFGHHKFTTLDNIDAICGGVFSIDDLVSNVVLLQEGALKFVESPRGPMFQVG